MGFISMTSSASIWDLSACQHVGEELPLFEFCITSSAVIWDFFMTISMDVQVWIFSEPSTLRTICMHAENNYTKMCVSIIQFYHYMHVYVYGSFIVVKFSWALGKLNVISHETVIMCKDLKNNCLDGHETIALNA